MSFQDVQEIARVTGDVGGPFAEGATLANGADPLGEEFALGGVLLGFLAFHFQVVGAVFVNDAAAQFVFRERWRREHHASTAQIAFRDANELSEEQFAVSALARFHEAIDFGGTLEDNALHALIAAKFFDIDAGQLAPVWLSVRLTSWPEYRNRWRKRRPRMQEEAGWKPALRHRGFVLGFCFAKHSGIDVKYCFRIAYTVDWNLLVGRLEVLAGLRVVANEVLRVSQISEDFADVGFIAKGARAAPRRGS